MTTKAPQTKPDGPKPKPNPAPPPWSDDSGYDVVVRKPWGLPPLTPLPARREPDHRREAVDELRLAAREWCDAFDGGRPMSMASIDAAIDDLKRARGDE